MRRSLVRGCLIGALTLLPGVTPAGFARAQDAGGEVVISEAPAGIGVGVVIVIDLQRILRESTAMQTLQAQVSAARDAFQSEIRQREEELRARDQELARERPTLAPEVYAERRKELAEELAALQQAVQERRRQLDQVMSDGMRQVQSALLPIVQALAEDRSADIVLSKTAIILVRPELEITDAALARLDEILPAVTVMPSN